MIFKKLVLGMLHTNCYILGDENTNEVAVFDPGAKAENIIGTIDKNGYTVKYIIITHAHFDHVLALDEMKETYPDAKIVVCKADVPMLNVDSNNFSRHFKTFPPKSKADIEVVDGDKLCVGKVELEIWHTPGHSKGSMCILTDDMVISGDTLFYMSIGRTDFYGGDFDEIVASLKRLATLPDDTKVYPGHGDATTIGFEKENNQFMRG